MSYCHWCGEDLSGPPRTVYYDHEGKKYCSRFCRDESQKSQNENEDEARKGGKDFFWLRKGGKKVGRLIILIINLPLQLIGMIGEPYRNRTYNLLI